MGEGLLAEFEDEGALARAAHALRAEGYRELEAFMPFPSEEVLEALEVPKSRVPLFVLMGALLGGSLGYLVLWWTNVVDYPLDVGGRDPHPWPAFLPITFESAILLGGVAGSSTLRSACTGRPTDKPKPSTRPSIRTMERRTKMGIRDMCVYWRTLPLEIRAGEADFECGVRCI